MKLLFHSGRAAAHEDDALAMDDPDVEDRRDRTEIERTRVPFSAVPCNVKPPRAA
jgi:hypothetical protein